MRFPRRTLGQRRTEELQALPVSSGWRLAYPGPILRPRQRIPLPLRRINDAVLVNLSVAERPAHWFNGLQAVVSLRDAVLEWGWQLADAEGPSC